MVGGLVGLLLGVLVAAFLDRWLRGLEPADVRARRVHLTRELPWVGDLLAAAVAGGASPEGALAAVAQVTGPPLGEQLRAVTAAVQLGASPPLAWSNADPALAALGRSMIRAGERGTPAAEELSRLAEDLRAAARTTSAAAVRAAAVHALAPLGACFLPAFLLLAVLPMVSGHRRPARDLTPGDRPPASPAQPLRPRCSVGPGSAPFRAPGWHRPRASGARRRPDAGPGGGLDDRPILGNCPTAGPPAGCDPACSAATTAPYPPIRRHDRRRLRLRRVLYKILKTTP